jgi:hypothetical protein
MKLREYLDANIMEIRQFAAKVPVTEHTVYNWLYKGIVPLRIYQLVVQKITDGQVTLKDWEKKDEKKKTNKRIRSTKDNGMRTAQHMDANKATKPKSSKSK